MLSDWQDGVPPCDGVWEIRVPEHDDSTICTYFARFKNGTWSSGTNLSSVLSKVIHVPYPGNNVPTNPRKWRGVIDD